MGTLRLVIGILILVIGIGFLFWVFVFTNFTEYPSVLVSTLGLGIIMIAVGALLISKYDADKKDEGKEKSKNS